jgi:ferredoxin
VKKGDARMTYTIAEPCVDVKNKSCVDVCPVSCIYIEDEELDRLLYINPDECIECGACEPECPVTAIFHDSAVPAEWAEYNDLNRDWFVDKEAVRERVNEIKPPE